MSTQKLNLKNNAFELGYIDREILSNLELIPSLFIQYLISQSFVTKLGIIIPFAMQEYYSAKDDTPEEFIFNNLYNHNSDLLKGLIDDKIKLLSLTQPEYSAPVKSQAPNANWQRFPNKKRFNPVNVMPQDDLGKKIKQMQELWAKRFPHDCTKYYNMIIDLSNFIMDLITQKRINEYVKYIREFDLDLNGETIWKIPDQFILNDSYKLENIKNHE